MIGSIAPADAGDHAAPRRRLERLVERLRQHRRRDSPDVKATVDARLEAIGRAGAVAATCAVYVKLPQGTGRQMGDYPTTSAPLEGSPDEIADQLRAFAAAGADADAARRRPDRARQHRVAGRRAGAELRSTSAVQQITTCIARTASTTLRQQIVTQHAIATNRRRALRSTRRKHARGARSCSSTASDLARRCFLLCRRAPRDSAATPVSGHSRAAGSIPGEDALAAALREVDEELGLRLDAGCRRRLARRLSDPLGLRDLARRAVGGRQRRRWCRRPHEVTAVHQIGLAELLTREPRFVTIPESDRPVVQLPLGGDVIHAPTGAVLYQFRQVALAGRIDERVDHLEQPVFAWR